MMKILVMMMVFVLHAYSAVAQKVTSETVASAMVTLYQWELSPPMNVLPNASAWRTGSGFMVAPRIGFTDYHVVDHSSSQSLTAFLNGRYVPIKVVLTKPEIDFAVFELLEDYSTVTLALSRDDWRLTSATLWGDYRGSNSPFTTKSLMMRQGMPSESVWIDDSGHPFHWLACYEIPSRKGCSGGPVIDDDTGLVVGMAHGYSKENENTLAIKMSAIREFLKGTKYEVLF